MQCKHLIKLIKSWYLDVVDNKMAPPRMISLIKQHASRCHVCLADPDIMVETEKITQFILPEGLILTSLGKTVEKEAMGEVIDDLAFP